MLSALFRRIVITISSVLLMTMWLILTVAPQAEALAQSSTVASNHQQHQARAASAAPKAQTFTVSSSVQWVSTGISLNSGDTLNVSATGSWIADPTDGPTGPDGYSQQYPDNFLNLTDIGACSACASTPTPHWGALIGYIGNNPPAAGSYTSTSILPEAQKVFVVGSSFNSAVNNSGTLWLNFNDDAYSAFTSDNSGQVTATVSVGTQPQVADLVVTKTVAAPAPNSQGDEADFQITVTNKGPVTATNVSVTDNLPSGVLLENPPQTSQGSCTYTDISATCSLNTIAVGKSAMVFLTTSTYNHGRITNKAKGTATQSDPNQANNTGSAVITLQPASTSSHLQNQLRQYGIKLKALGLILEEAECGGLHNLAVCTVLGTELLAKQPGLTGERAASYLRVELATLCVKGLETDTLWECADLWIYALSELAAPPPAG